MPAQNNQWPYDIRPVNTMLHPGCFGLTPMNLFTKIKQYAQHLKSEIYALYFAARDPRTPWYAKLIVASIVAYALSPIDLIPDFVPILGYLDDLILLPLGIALAIKLIPDYVGVLNLKISPFLLIAGGSLVGFLSGLLGSAGPLGAAIFLSLGLSPVAYIASEGTTALAIHGVKIITYHQYIILDQDLWLLATFMGVAMIAGSWSAKQVIEYMPQKKFERYVTVLLVVLAIYLIVYGS